MRTVNGLVVRVLLIALLLFGELATIEAQESGDEIGSDGRPVGAQPGPTPVPTGQLIVVMDEADSDEPGVGAAGDVVIQDQVINDNLIVTGSICTGFDCANGESFDVDTIRLKENNLRIHFDDTSSTGYFPTNDWRIVVNDSTNGGASYFAVENSTGNKTPFKIEAEARQDALYVGHDGSNSSVGIGAVPDSGINLQVTDSWTPYLRLKLNDLGGWSPYAWDLVANESNFYITDPTAGSGRYPFRIYPGAPTGSLFIGGADRGNRPGYIGMGTSAPEAALHVTRPDLSWRPAQILIEEPNNVPVEDRILFEATNQGAVQMRLRDRTAGAYWTLGFGTDGFTASYTSTTESNVGVFHLKPDGNLTIARALTEMSDAAHKENFAPVDGSKVLARLAEMPVRTWNYKGDEATMRHIGPTAQDFHAAFELGQDDRHIAPLDTNGVALAAIQELYRQVQSQSARLEALERENMILKAQLEALQ